MTATETAWKTLAGFLELPSRLAAGEPVRVSADTIKKVTGREPRLMMKFDKREDRPRSLGQGTILPVSNGEYVILPGDGYHSVEPSNDLMHWQLPSTARELVTLPWADTPSSESQILDTALASGILNDFLDEDQLFLTIRGRLRAPQFDFRFTTSSHSHHLTAGGVQVEVDAGLEGRNINLVEAKLGKRSNFHIRQLYYPVRMWQQRQDRKPTRAVFAGYSDRILSLRLYRFEPLESFRSLVLDKSADYTFAEADGPAVSIERAVAETGLEPYPRGVTFPQADDMEKVLDVIDAAAAGMIAGAELTERYGFVARQAAYYQTAAQFLGFLERGRQGIALTELGARFATSSRRSRHSLVHTQLAKRPVFRQAIEHALSAGSPPPKELIAEWIKASTDLTGATPLRRAQTVKSWTLWALGDQTKQG